MWGDRMRAGTSCRWPPAPCRPQNVDLDKIALLSCAAFRSQEARASGGSYVEVGLLFLSLRGNRNVSCRAHRWREPWRRV